MRIRQQLLLGMARPHMPPTPELTSRWRRDSARGSSKAKPRASTRTLKAGGMSAPPSVGSCEMKGVRSFSFFLPFDPGSDARSDAAGVVGARAPADARWGDAKALIGPPISVHFTDTSTDLASCCANYACGLGSGAAAVVR